MAKVEQKVGLDASEYVKGTQKLAKETQSQMKRVNNEFSQSGDKIDDFTEGARKSVGLLNSSFGELFKGLATKLKGLPLGKFAAIGTALAGIGKAQAGLDATTASAQSLGFQQGLDQFQTAGLKNLLLDASSAANVDFQEVANAAREGIARGATSTGAVGSAEVAAQLSRLSDQLDPRTAAEFIARTLQAREQDINEKNARAIADAVTVATRNGFKDAGEAVSVLSEFDPKALADAQISPRELVNLLGGLRTGVGATSEQSTALLKDLINIQRGDIGQAEALRGITGIQLRQGEQFQLRREDLEQLQGRLGQLGETRVRRQLLQETGLSEGAADALLALAKDPGKFFQAQEATAGDTASLVQAFEANTATFTEKLSSGWNWFLNQAEKPLIVIDPKTGEIGLPNTDVDNDLGKISERAAQVKEFGFQRMGQGQNVQTATDPAAQQQVKVEVEVDSKDPGFLAKPKSTDQFRQPGGF